MKKYMSIVLMAALLLCICGCTTVSISKNSSAVLNFHYETNKHSYNIKQSLTAEETTTVINIFNGKSRCNALTYGVPSCGFDPDIYIQIGTTKYHIATDSCGTVYISGTMDYFDLSSEEIEVIHTIFKKYGGFIPCW